MVRVSEAEAVPQVRETEHEPEERVMVLEPEVSGVGLNVHTLVLHPGLRVHPDADTLLDDQLSVTG